MRTDGYVLTINPGSTSTKVALFKDNQNILQQNLSHSAQELDKLGRVADQYEYRLKIVLGWLDKEGIDLKSLIAVAGRGGMLPPIPSGTYKVTQTMVDFVREAVTGEHASNLGPMLAKGIADRTGVPAFIADPVTVDEFDDIARISGMPEVPRVAKSHALNIRAVAYRVAKEEGKPLEQLKMVIAHLGGGITVAPLDCGKIIDANSANVHGPFSPERCGGLPTGALIKLAYSGKFTKQDLSKKLLGKAGLVGYLGTTDAREVESMIEQGDQRAELVFKAMGYQIAKDIGAMATVLKGRVDFIILTGGLAHSKRLVSIIDDMIGFIAPVKTYPGEDEMQALAEGVYRVLSGGQTAKIMEEEVRQYD